VGPPGGDGGHCAGGKVRTTPIVPMLESWMSWAQRSGACESDWNACWGLLHERTMSFDNVTLPFTRHFLRNVVKSTLFFD
jgi:hypothetical protein